MNGLLYRAARVDLVTTAGEISAVGLIATDSDRQTDRQTSTDGPVDGLSSVVGSSTHKGQSSLRRRRNYRGADFSSFFLGQTTISLPPLSSPSLLSYDTRCYFNVRSKANMSRLNLPHGNDNYKKLSYRRGTARCIVSIEILSIATQQCRNYLYDKS